MNLYFHMIVQIFNFLDVRHGRTALIETVRKGDKEIVSELIQAGCDVDAKDK